MTCCMKYFFYSAMLINGSCQNGSSVPECFYSKRIIGCFFSSRKVMGNLSVRCTHSQGAVDFFQDQLQTIRVSMSRVVYFQTDQSLLHFLYLEEILFVYLFVRSYLLGEINLPLSLRLPLLPVVARGSSVAELRT